MPLTAPMMYLECSHSLPPAVRVTDHMGVDAGVDMGMGYAQRYSCMGVDASVDMGMGFTSPRSSMIKMKFLRIASSFNTPI